jgi:hypothetical protein
MIQSWLKLSDSYKIQYSSFETLLNEYESIVGINSIYSYYFCKRINIKSK